MDENLELSVVLPCGVNPASAVDLIQEEVASQLEMAQITPTWSEITEVGRAVNAAYVIEDVDDRQSRLSITIRLKFKKWSLSITIEF